VDRLKVEGFCFSLQAIYLRKGIFLELPVEMYDKGFPIPRKYFISNASWQQ
jgi:hypothetical protein